MERRDWRRVVFGGRVLITRKNKRMEKGEIQNLSLHDVFVQTPLNMPLYDLVELQLFLGEADSCVTLAGFVVRRDPAGLAIRFIGHDFETFTLLKKVVAYATDNETTTISQFLGRMKTLGFPATKRRCAADQ